MDDAGQKTSEIDDNPIDRVRADVDDPVATLQADRLEGRGEIDGGRCHLEPSPGRRRVIGRRLRGQGRPGGGVVEAGGEEIDEGRVAGLPRSIDDTLSRLRAGRHVAILSTTNAIPWPSPIHIVARPSRSPRSRMA
jgi:hypothetical protein